MHDLINLIFFILLITVIGAIAETFARKNIFSAQISRMLFFFLLSLFSAFAFLIIDNFFAQVLLALILTISSLFFLREKGTLLFGKRNGSNQFLFFSIAFLIEVLIFKSHRFFAFYSLVTFSVIVLLKGFANPKEGKTIKVTSEGKSYSDLTIVFAVTFLFLILIEQLRAVSFLDFKYTFSFTYLFVSSALIAAIITLFDAASSKGAEYLNVPLFTGILIFIFLETQNNELLFNFSLGLFLSLVVAYLSYKVEFLTLSGAVVTFLLAGFIFGLGGWKWSIPILAFFILSSILSKVRKKKNTDVDFYFEKTGVRDHWQVIANGGLGGILILLNQMSPNEIYYYAYLASLAAVCADTWATEIGTMYPAKTVNILTFKEIAQGVSGGISFRGTFGAFLGAFVIAISGMFWVKATLFYFALVSFAGLLGSIFDSLLGATVQLQNQCVVCEKITERQIHCGAETKYFRGLKWLNNDIVNLSAGLFGIFVIIAFNSF